MKTIELKLIIKVLVKVPNQTTSNPSANPTKTVSFYLGDKFSNAPTPLCFTLHDGGIVRYLQSGTKGHIQGILDRYNNFINKNSDLILKTEVSGKWLDGRNYFEISCIRDIECFMEIAEAPLPQPIPAAITFKKLNMI